MADHVRLSITDEIQAVNDRRGTIGSVGIFAGEPPDLGDVRRRVAERWGPLARMSWRLELAPARRGTARRHRWATGAPRFDPAVHVGHAAGALDDVMAGSVRQSLGTGLPPWRLLVVRQVPFGGDFALMLLADHALLDGRSLLTLLRLLTDETAAVRPALPAPRPGAPRSAVARELLAVLANGQAVPGPPAGAAQPDMAITDVRPDTIRAARRLPAAGRGATLTELLVGSVAGALRTSYGPPSRWLKGAAPVFAAVPIDLRTGAGAQELGNIVSAVRVPLPVGEGDPAVRLRVCQRATATVPARRASHHRMHGMLQALGRPGPWLAKAFAAHLRAPAHAPMGCNAFKWPGHPASALYGRPLLRVFGLSVSAPGSAAFALVQTGAVFTLTTVTCLRPGDAHLLANAVVRELETLAELAGAPAHERTLDVA